MWTPSHAQEPGGLASVGLATSGGRHPRQLPQAWVWAADRQAGPDPPRPTLGELLGALPSTEQAPGDYLSSGVSLRQLPGPRAALVSTQGAVSLRLWAPPCR